MSKKHKKKLVEKVSHETHVEEKDLDRLPTDALEKLDALTPDDELLGGPNEDTTSGTLPESPADAVSSDDGGSEGEDSDGDGVQEDGIEDEGFTGLGDSEGLAAEHDDQCGSPAGTSVESEPSLSQEGSVDSGSAVPTGTQVLGETAGAQIVPSETPTQTIEVAQGQGQRVCDEPVSKWAPVSTVVTDETILGLHPMTGKPVRFCDQ